MVRALNNLAILSYYQGQNAAALSQMEECLAIYRELGDDTGIAVMLSNLGELATVLGNYDSARALLEEGIAIYRVLGARSGVALCLHNLASLALAQGHYNSARSLYEESHGMYQALGETWGVAGALCGLGKTAARQGDHAVACSFFQESLALQQRRLGDKASVASLLEELAVALLAAAKAGYQQKDVARRAIRLLGAAEALRETLGFNEAPAEAANIEASIASTRAVLGQDVFVAAWTAGKSLTWEQAVTEALKQDNT
jgi:tetratricopeptide (TPR) repeat protein